MASTNKTANLSLNQWVKSDPVLMEDMNEDNRKLDAALNEVGVVTLFSVVLKKTVQTVEMNFKNVDMSNIVALDAYVYAPEYDATITLRINNLAASENYQYQYSGTWTSLGSGFSAYCCKVPIVFKYSTCYSLLKDGTLVRVNPPVASTAINCISFVGNGTIPPGTKFVLTGVKA